MTFALGSPAGHRCTGEKFAYDVDYVDHVSFALDVKIIFMTVRCVFAREGISAEGSATMEAFTGTGAAVHE